MKFVLTVLLIICVQIFLLVSKAKAHVESIYYLKGTLGNRQMVMKIYCYDEIKTRYATYFFTNDKADRYLTGELKNDAWEFAPSARAEPVSNKELITITEIKKGVWTGIWDDNNGNKAVINLSEFTNNSYVNNYNRTLYVSELDPYDGYRTAIITFVKVKSEQKTKNLECVWFKEPESGLLFFRINDKSRKINTTSLNKNLEATHLFLVKNYFTYQLNKKSVTSTTNVLFANNHLLSYSTNTTTLFYKSPPSISRQLSTLSVTDGETLKLEDLVWFDKNTMPSEAFDVLYTYRKTFFAPKIFGLLKDLYPDKFASNNCKYNLVYTWQLPMWCLTNKGLALASVTPDNCDYFNWAIIPYRKLTTYWNRKYLITK